ncbi:MAG: hypothetical protein AAF413_01545 [Patescibacteria group bacterium]
MQVGLHAGFEMYFNAMAEARLSDIDYDDGPVEKLLVAKSMLGLSVRPTGSQIDRLVVNEECPEEALVEDHLQIIEKLVGLESDALVLRQFRVLGAMSLSESRPFDIVYAPFPLWMRRMVDLATGPGPKSQSLHRIFSAWSSTGTDSREFYRSVARVQSHSVGSRNRRDCPFEQILTGMQRDLTVTGPLPQ